MGGEGGGRLVEREGGERRGNGRGGGRGKRKGGMGETEGWRSGEKGCYS